MNALSRSAILVPEGYLGMSPLVRGASIVAIAFGLLQALLLGHFIVLAPIFWIAG